MDLVPAQIVIEFDAGTAPITGRVRTDARPARPFTGWTGLFAVLRAVAGEEPADHSSSRKETQQ